jgi:hypothetical protein
VGKAAIGQDGGGHPSIGRDQFDRGSARIGTSRSTQRRLQWGRDQLIAETAAWPLQKNICQQASMGAQ